MGVGRSAYHAPMGAAERHVGVVVIVVFKAPKADKAGGERMGTARWKVGAKEGSSRGDKKVRREGVRGDLVAI